MSRHSTAPESLTRQRTGLTPGELALVIAALAAEEAQQPATAATLGSAAGVSPSATTRLLDAGWLRRAERVGRGFALRGTSRAWRFYEFGETDGQ